MTSPDPRRDEIAAVLEVHQLAWIDHGIGWDCGCNERGDLPAMPSILDGLRHQADVIMPILHAAEGLARAETVRAVKEKLR